MVFAQICLVCLEVFGGGVFLAWKDCPAYWRWLQEITVFTHGSRMMIMEILQYLTFKCELMGGVCIEPGTANRYDCKTFSDNGKFCEVDGREMLSVAQGVGPDESHWIDFVYLLIIWICLKLGVALLTYYPLDRLYYMAAVLMTKNMDSNQGSVAVTKTSPSGGEAQYGAAPHVDPEEGIGNRGTGQMMRERSFHTADESGTLSWNDFSVILPKTGARLVDSVSGFVKSGRILALMGPSGAGKTTLLK